MMTNTSTCNLCTDFLKDLKEPYWRYHNKIREYGKQRIQIRKQKGRF